MDKLKVSLSALPEEGAVIDATVDGAQLDLPNGPGDTVHVHGRLTPVDTEYLFKGAIEGSSTQPCDRCLRTSSRPFAMEVTWFFEPGEDEDDLDLGDTAELTHEDVNGEAARYFSGNEIDLTEHIREEILLAAPSKFLCEDECKGLCARCGANLNDGPCNCVQEETTTGHPGLAKLAEQFPDLRPSEE